jgi:hypothetical protein
MAPIDFDPLVQQQLSTTAQYYSVGFDNKNTGQE